MTTRAKELADKLRRFESECSPGQWEHEGTGIVVTKENDLLVSTPTFLRFVGGADKCAGSSLVDADFIAWCRNEALTIAAHLDRLAAIDSAVPGEVGEIRERHHAYMGRPTRHKDHPVVVQFADDIATLLAIVQRQAGDIQAALNPARGNEQERDAARAEVKRLTERLRTMQHGETEALKMMAAEKQRAEVLTDLVCAADPIGWAIAGRIESADAWQKRAEALLKGDGK